jgi:hypothetical protein
MVRPQPILGYLRYVGVGRRAINPFNQRRIIRICLRAIDPLRHRPALQVVGQGLASEARLPSTKSCRKLSSRPRGGNAQAPHRCDTLEIVSWTANTPTSPRPSLRVTIAALGRCNCFDELHDLAGCLISTPSTAAAAAYYPSAQHGFFPRHTHVGALESLSAARSSRARAKAAKVSGAV